MQGTETGLNTGFKKKIQHEYMNKSVDITVGYVNERSVDIKSLKRVAFNFSHA